MRETIFRDAGTGQIVTEEYALANPQTTVKETITDVRGLLLDFCDVVSHPATPAPPVGPIQQWLVDKLDMSEEDALEEAKKISKKISGNGKI